MKLLRLKITDPKGFRSLAPGFEFHFRAELNTPDDLANSDVEPFVCAGRNGSGKSNLLEALASIFYQLEIQRVRRTFLPEVFDTIAESVPDGFEIEYMMPLWSSLQRVAGKTNAHVRITKQPGLSPEIVWVDTPEGGNRITNELERDFLLPTYVVGYSSGENEILSLPFFKMRFVQFDEFWHSLKEQLPYSGRPDARMTYLDREYSQAILLCNILFQTPETLIAYAGDIGIQNLKEFRILLKRGISLPDEEILAFGNLVPNWGSVEDITRAHPNLSEHEDRFNGKYRKVHLLGLLSGVVESLKRCATCWYNDESTDTLVLDYWVNDATRDAFRANFESALELFQTFQVLLNLNLYSVSSELKTDLYQSSSHYVNETVPVLASDERIFRFKEFYVTKKGVSQPLLLKELSDGEHQLLHSLGLCLLFGGTNSLFLLDEPETHFNPDWRAQFITRLRECLTAANSTSANSFVSQEILITTHTPFLISDSKPERVLVFKKDESGTVTIEHPNYNTLGASINKITMKTFVKTETVGGIANSMIQTFRRRFEAGENPDVLIDQIDHVLGDSVEKILLIKSILGRTEPQS